MGRMFQRYTVLARRAIFFARYEASEFGSPCIDSAHILRGLLREDPTLAREAPLETIREQIGAKLPRAKRLPASVDLPLSRDAKSALSHAAEDLTEADAKNYGVSSRNRVTRALVCSQLSTSAESCFLPAAVRA